RITVDRSSTVGGRIYLDGQRIRNFNPRRVSGSLSNDERLEIGRNNSGSNHFNGLIDEVNLFDRSLTSSEIAEIWRADTFGLCKPGLVPAPLTATLACVGVGVGVGVGAGDGYACQVTSVDGSGGNGFSWSYFGDGNLFPSGDSAQVMIGSCSGSLNHITVTVTDSSGASVSAARNLPCLGGFG
ncbi:MAG: LamG-like jellyroll fold domain-containing protein, partial [Acidobacteriota bacterium]